MALKDMLPTINRQWLVAGLFGLLVIVGGAGTCQQYVPVGQPGAKPIVRPGTNQIFMPSDVWQPLETPSKNAVDGLVLPQPLKISSSRKWVILTAKCDTRVRWLVTAKSGTPVDALESPITNSILIFSTSKPNDIIVVLAYAATSNVATDPVITYIAITGDTPPPNPDPDPDPNPTPSPEPSGKKPSKLHVTFVLDFAKQTRAISDVINNSDLRKWLTDQGHHVHEVSIHDVGKYNLDMYIEGKAPPILVLQAQAEAGIKEGTLVPDVGVTQLYSVQAVKDAVLKATGKKE